MQTFCIHQCNAPAGMIIYTACMWGLNTLSSRGAQRSAGELTGSCKNRWKKSRKSIHSHLAVTVVWFSVPCGSSTAEITEDVCVCRENITSIIHSGARKTAAFPHLTFYSCCTSLLIWFYQTPIYHQTHHLYWHKNSVAPAFKVYSFIWYVG